jgi:DNA repair exonuclease SbcCD nuclease subunit
MIINIVGDLHLDDRTPRSRVDDYTVAQLYKLDYILSSAPMTIFLGDIFNKPGINFITFYQILTLIQKHKAQGKRILTIIGNHDIYNMCENTLPKTALGLLQAIGLIEIITSDLTVDNLYINTIPLVFNVNKDVLKSYEGDKISVLLGHHFYQSIISPTHCFTKEMLVDLNYKYIFLGHDHQPYEPDYIEKSGTTVFRPGSIMRNAAFDYQVNRVPHYLQLNSETGEVRTKIIENIKIGRDIFTTEVIEKKQYDKNDNFLYNIDTIVRQFNNTTIADDQSIQKILLDLKTPPNMMDYLRQLHEREEVKFI